MSLFEAYNQQQAQQSYVPQQRANLQTAYNQALGQRTPNWAIHLSNAMPSIAEIVALGTTKGAFNQGRIADSLERQKNRQIAYTQALQNMEDNRVKDYVQMAKDQLNLDIADEERAYNRDLTANQIAYKKAQDLLEQQNKDRQFEFAKEQAEQAQKNFDKQYNLKLNELSNKPTEMTPEEKLAWELKVEDAKANAKAKREAEQDLNKANAEYESFKSNIDNLQDLSKKSGSTISRAIGGVGNLFDVITGKDTGITKPNDAMQEVKAQLVQAIFKANGIDGDKINKEQSKIILRQAGMPDSGDLSQSQVNTIIKNIDSIYKQRIAGKKNLADSFNSVSWE